MKSQRNEGELVTSIIYEHTKRKTITHTLLRKLQIQCVKDFFCSHESSNIDSNSIRLVAVKNENIVERRVRRVWIFSTIDEQYALVYKSDTMQTYLQLYPNFKIPSCSYFYDLCCSYADNPTM